MKFSLMTEPQLGGTYDDILAAARWAESVGMVGFARSDHYYSSRVPAPDATDAFATIAGLARETTSIRLCILVTPITFRHPAVIAKTAATIDQMSGGRLDLGIGTGWMELEHTAFGLPFPESDERFSRLEEALAYVSAAFEGKPFHGTHYRIGADALPRAAGTRIVVGGSGTRLTPALAGRFAHEYNHFVATPPEIAPKVTRMREAAERAERDPSQIEVTVMGPVVAGRDRTEYEDRLSESARARGEEPEAIERRWRESGVPHGTPAQIAETMASLEAVGVTRFYLQWLDLSDLSGLDPTWQALARSR